MRMSGQVIGASPTIATRRSVILSSEGLEAGLTLPRAASASRSVAKPTAPAPAAAIPTDLKKDRRPTRASTRRLHGEPPARPVGALTVRRGVWGDHMGVRSLSIVRRIRPAADGPRAGRGPVRLRARPGPGPRDAAARGLPRRARGAAGRGGAHPPRPPRQGRVRGRGPERQEVRARPGRALRQGRRRLPDRGRQRPVGGAAHDHASAAGASACRSAARRPTTSSS